MLTKKAKYAIKSLTFLYRNSEKLPISAKNISDNENIPYKFLENILRELKHHKILKSTRGADGGYTFLKDPNDILISDIIRIIDGPIALIPCVSENFYEKCQECIDEKTCEIRHLFYTIRAQMIPILNISIIEFSKIQ